MEEFGKFVSEVSNGYTIVPVFSNDIFGFYDIEQRGIKNNHVGEMIISDFPNQPYVKVVAHDIDLALFIQETFMEIPF